MSKRTRSCLNGSVGQGSCDGDEEEFKKCSSGICLPLCPPGFDATTSSGGKYHNKLVPPHTFYLPIIAWTCYKLFKTAQTLSEARRRCHSLSDQGNLIGATLASDKTASTHQILTDMIITAGLSTAYIGVNFDVNFLVIFL